MHSGHRKRMKEKFLRDGLDNFKDHEILEFLLYQSIPRRNTNDIGHNLIDSFGLISSVFDAPLNALKSIDGIGESSAILLKLIPECARIYMQDKCNIKNKITCSDDAGKILLPKFVGRMNEVVILMLLDAKNKIVFCGVVNYGNVNSVDIYVKKIMELAILYNAKSAIISHNHPSGIAIPSTNDLLSTKKLYIALYYIGVTLSDHIIVADDDFVSLADSNLSQDLFNLNELAF